jgi:hypothetical protein
LIGEAFKKYWVVNERKKTAFIKMPAVFLLDYGVPACAFRGILVFALVYYEFFISYMPNNGKIGFYFLSSQNLPWQWW